MPPADTCSGTSSVTSTGSQTAPSSSISAMKPTCCCAGPALLHTLHIVDLPFCTTAHLYGHGARCSSKIGLWHPEQVLE